jgi:hypothetical protein
MSGVTPAQPCVTGVTLTDPTMCSVLNEASMKPLEGPYIIPATPISDELLPARLRQAITDCTGTSPCKFIGYDFDSGVDTKASASRYVVDTYSTTVENSGILVSKGKKTSGTVSGVTAANGGSTGTVMYTADNGQTYTFQGVWRSLQTNMATVDVYFDPVNMSRGALRPEDLDLAPPILSQPPGYELPDFQAASTAGSNLINRPVAASVEECAEQCDLASGCTGFNFGGLDTSSICELVKDTTTRAYVDGMSGFRKETISSTQTGDGTNPSGTDLTNQGIYCRDALACNADIAQIITENVGATNTIASLSTSDISSCAYCPLRTYATAGNVTTNELGVSKTNPTPAAAITELQYSSDDTFATHLTITPGKWYKMSSWKSITTGGNRLEFYMSPIATSTPGIFNMLCFRDRFFVAKNFSKGNEMIKIVNQVWGQENYIFTEAIDDLSEFLYISPVASDMNFFFNTVDYVTNGFIIGSSELGSFTHEYINGPIFYPEKTSSYASMNRFWHLNKFTSGRLTTDYNNAVLVISEMTDSDLFGIISQSSWYVPGEIILDSNGNPYIPNISHTNPLIYINSADEKFKLELVDNKMIFRKFADATMFSWYKESNNWWDGPYINTWMEQKYTYAKVYSGRADGPFKPLNKINSDSPLWTLFPIRDMPDPYAALGQFRTLDIAPPSTAQDWAYARRQGCNKNCGNIANGYAIYSCRGKGRGNCDPGQGASVSGPVCSGTHISCRPADNSVDLKDQFSFKFSGLVQTTVTVTGGGSATTHNADALRIRTIYTLGSSVSTTPAESIQKLSTIFPPFVVARIRQAAVIIPSLLCSSGIYVNGISCAMCPGNPQPTATQVWRPDPNNFGSTLCAFDECPAGQIPDSVHILCRNNTCPPGSAVTAANACDACPRIQYPFGAMSTATTGPGYYWPDAPLPINVIWKPNTSIPGTYLCEFSLCLQSGTWAVDNNTRCGGTCPRRSEMNTDGTCRQCPALPSNVRVDQTWDYDMIDAPDGSGQLASYKCTLRQCPVGSYTLGYNERTCRSCDSTTASFTFNAAGFHSQYGYTPPAVGDWTNAQKEAYCTFSACKPGYQNYVAAQKACTQSCLPPPTGFTATYSSGCTISACTVVPGGPIASGGVSATSGRCEATVCAANYTWNGSCTACLNGGTIVSGPASGNNRACTCLTGYRDLLCENCSLNYRWNGTACVACPTGATIEIGPASGNARLCTCATGYTGSSCENCAINYRWNGAACVECVNLHTWANAPRSSSAQVGPASGASRSCTCYTGYTGTSCDQCAANYIWAGQCAPCYNGGTKLSAPAVSVAGASCTCPPGYTGTQCQTCVANYAWTGSACVACALYSTIESGEAWGPARTCTLPENCAMNYTWNSSACVACQNGSTIASGPKAGPARSCTCPILTGATTTIYSGITCTECAANHYYSTAGGGGCYQCQRGGTTVAGLSTACTCPTGYAGASCVGCATNYTWIGSACVACLNGGTATALQGLPCTCPPTHTGTKCENCAANYTWNGSACVACPTGGTIVSGPASGNARTCIVCPTGYMLGSGTSCDTCSSNYRWNGSACVACQNGGFSWSGLAAGQERLCTCAPGYTGGSCENCPTNYTWNGSACVACPTGSTIESGAASGNARSCTCPTGKTGTNCENCAANYTWAFAACVACPTGSTAATGPASGDWRSCTCPTGYTDYACGVCAANYRWNESACVACQNGGTIVMRVASGNAQSCACNTGYTGSSCENCAANYRWNAISSYCEPCLNGGTIAGGSASGAGRNCACNTGYTGSSCQNCEWNYRWNAASSICTACLNGGTIAGGSASGAGRNCACLAGYTGSSCQNCQSGYRKVGTKCLK